MKVYCIRHEEMVLAERIRGEARYHLHFVEVDYAPIRRLDACDFPDGFAYCPPPEFDIDSFAESAYPLDEVHADRLPGRDYDFENDEIVMEELL